MDRIRIAFIGASHSHAQAKIQVVRESRAWELVGVYEEDPRIRAELEKSGVQLRARDEILADASIPVVAVESAVGDHALHGRLAVEAGKHVHLEKPPADNLRAFREIVTIAERKHLLVQMGYMWRYNPAVNRALEAARKGWLGDIYLVRGMMNTLIGAERRPDWALFRGGQMFEQGAHLIDIVVRLLGKPAKIASFLRTHGNFKDRLADNTVAIFDYPKAMAIIQSAVLQPNANAHRCLEICGSNGTAVVRPLEPPVLAIDLAKPAGPYEAKLQTFPAMPYRRYVGDFDELAEAIRTRQPLSITPQDDLLVQETLLEASEM